MDESVDRPMSILRDRMSMSPQLDRLAELAREDPERQFFSIAHLLTPEFLYGAFLRLRKDASAGVDGVTYRQYQEGAWERILALHGRLREQRYRAQPLRRIYVPKEDGTRRGISIPGGQDRAEGGGGAAPSDL